MAPPPLPPSRGRGEPVEPGPPPTPHDPPQTAPHDELVSVVRELVEASPRRSVVIDVVAGALKARGFLRPPGSPRLVTRLRRIRELVVSPSGMITLAEGDGSRGRAAEAAARRDEAEEREEQAAHEGDEAPSEDEGAEEPGADERGPDEPAPAGARPPRGRRRRRRRRRGGAPPAAAASPAV
jgi:hypothetical protein